MTIEHSTISFGEIHPAANWAVTSGGVAALGGIPVGDGDIGKVAWVAGVGHYVLASTAPAVWESLGVTITDMTYDIPSATLSITLSDGTTHSVVIVAGLSESEVNTLITDALTSYDTAIKTYIGNSITTALGALTTANIPDSTNRRYVSDAQLAVLGNTSGTNSGDETTASIKTKLGAASSTKDGYLTSTDWSTFNSKQAALADVITAGAYGSSTQWPVITFNAKGIATGVTLQTVPTPTFTDATFIVQKNGSPSIAASWDLTALTASRVHTYPNKAINFGDLPSVATTNSNTISATALRCSILGGQSNTVSGTDNVILASSNCAVSSTQCTIIGSTAVTLAGTEQRNVTVSNVVLVNSRSFTFPSGTLVTGSSASASGSVAHIKTFSAFRLARHASATVLVQDVNNVKPYAVLSKYSPSYYDVGLHRVTVLGTLNANNYTVCTVHVRRDYGVTVTTIEAGGGYITLSAAQNGDRLDLTVSTTLLNENTFTVFVESYYTDCG